MIPPLTDRISLLHLCQQRFPGGIAVEIGAASGCFSKQILATWTNLQRLYCVDLWANQPEGYHDCCNLPDNVQEERFQQFQKDFGSNKKVRIVREWSHIASEAFEPASLDFVYLDANHSKPGSLSDLRAWWPRVKPGGIMAGHDYCPGNGEGMGVKEAVDEFAKDQGLEVHQTTSEFCRQSGVYGPGWEGYSFVLEKCP